MSPEPSRMPASTTVRFPMPAYASDDRVTLRVDLNMSHGPDVIWGGEDDQGTWADSKAAWTPLALDQHVWLLDEDGCRTPAVIIRLWHPPFGDGRARLYEARADFSQRSGYAEVTTYE